MDPHVINDRKYDVRLWVFVKSISPLIVFIYPRGIVRFAIKSYSSNKAHFYDRSMHVTNTKEQEKYATFTEVLELCFTLSCNSSNCSNCASRKIWATEDGHCQN